MMLVSSSGWAHSPITLIFTALSAVYWAALATGAALSATAITAASATPIRFTPLLLLCAVTHSNLPERTRTGKTGNTVFMAFFACQVGTARRQFGTTVFEAGSNRLGSVQ